jgi:hypothetical protein
MPEIKINFDPDIALHPDTHQLEFKYRPYLQVKIGHNNKLTSNFIRALVDSGSDRNLFPSSFATEIGINWTTGDKHKITGIGGKTIYSYGHLVTVKVKKRKIETIVYFAREITIPLLGRDGFFNFFKTISFDTRNKKMILFY